MGNELLEEMAEECLKHLKPGGQVYWVVQKHVKPFIERLFEKYFKDFKIIATNKEHFVIQAFKKG